MTETVLPDSEGAVILPFPRRAAPPAPDAAAPEDGADRLRRALENLAAAIQALRAANLDLRTGLGDLGGAMAQLGESTHAYQASLTRLRDDVGRLGAEARRLESWPDQATTGKCSR